MQTEKQLSFWRNIERERQEYLASVVNEAIEQEPQLLLLTTNQFVAEICKNFGVNLTQQQKDAFMQMPNIESLLRARRRIINQK